MNEDVKITFGAATRGKLLLYEIPRVLFDIDAIFVCDDSHLLDFDEVDDEVRRRAREEWGIEIPTDPEHQHLWEIADLITGAKPQ